jgi:hypothetical protein
MNTSVVSSGRRRAWLMPVTWFILASSVIWLLRTPDPSLRDWLRRWQFWSLEATCVLALSLSAVNLPRFLQSLNLERRDLRLPFGAAVLALALVVWVAPQTNRIYFDEHIYQGIGQNLADLRLAQMCNDGNVEYGILQCSRAEYNKEPYGYPYLLSLAYRLGGVHERTAFAVNAVAMFVLVWVVFLLTTALTERADAGGYAAVVAALIPEQLRWSHSAAAEPTAALACACAVLTAVAFVRLRTTVSLVWTALAGVLAVQFRPECALVVPVIAVVVGLFARDEYRRSRLWWSAAIAVALLTLHFAHLTAVRNEGWGTTGAKISASFFAANVATNGWFYLADSRFPFIYSLLAVTAFLRWRNRLAAAVGAVYFVLFWGVFLFFYAGSYNYGADARFSLMTYPPLSVMAGIGALHLIDRLDRLGWSSIPSRTVVVSLLCFQFLWYMPFVRSVGEEAWAARADVEFARQAAANLPRNSFVLTHNPSMFHLWGVSAGQASIAISDAGYVENDLMRRYAGGIYFHWNFWCNVADPVQRSFCTGILERFPHTMIREYRERDYRFAVYRIETP